MSSPLKGPIAEKRKPVKVPPFLNHHSWGSLTLPDQGSFYT